MNIRIPFIFALAICLSACVTATATKEPTPVPATSAAPIGPTKATTPTSAATSVRAEGVEARIQPASRPLNLTPYTQYSQIKTNSSSLSSYSGQYTRLRIDGRETCGDDCTAEYNQGGLGPEQYKYRSRSWLTRYLFGKQFDFNLSVKTTIGNYYEATSPLITVSHESDSNGEQWARGISHQLLDYPLFLVEGDGSTSIPTFEVKLAADKKIDSNLASAALQVAIGAIQQVSPGSNVLTTLTKDSSKARSTAIDQAISKLFTNGLTETHVANVQLQLWNSADGIQINLRMPGDENDWNHNPHPVGTWIIHFEPPRPSIFSDWRLCVPDDIPPPTKSDEQSESIDKKNALHCSEDGQTVIAKVHDSIEVGPILNYQLINSAEKTGTIQAYITQQEWYTSAMTSFRSENTADKAKIKAIVSGNQKTANDLCLKIENAITGLKLNQSDSEMVVWAVAAGLPLPAEVTTDVFKGKSTSGQPGPCLQAIADIDRDRDRPALTTKAELEEIP